MILGYLSIYQKDCNTQKFTKSVSPIFKNKQLKIGRNADMCDIVISNPVVSNLHCKVWGVKFDEQSVPNVYLQDVSLNGTIIYEKDKKTAFLINKYQFIMLKNNDESQYISFPKLKNSTYLKFHSLKEYRNDKLIGASLDLFFENLQIEQNIDANWKIVPQIVGSGTFGLVMICERTNSKREEKLFCAVKIVKHKQNIKISKESQILLNLKHPNIINIFSTKTDEYGNIYLFQDLICGGDLFSYLAKGNCLTPLPEDESLIIVYQILMALKYLHSKGVVHRDLKLDNILLRTPEPCTKIVLADFGIAKDIENIRTNRLHTVVGTPEYCAPEVGFRASRSLYKQVSRATTKSIVDEIGYNYKCDLWSLGVVTHIILTGISPFYGDGTEMCIIENVKSGKLNFSLAQWSVVSVHAKNFVSKLLNVNIEERLTSQQALTHLWISKHRVYLEEIYKFKILAEE
ncbi:related to Meiosis-specific serine/threonine-protein kinase MEK1 [Saccharomycodes ludwigii]|uniref:Related to Meiosis-specific serine/threonine-protein kinase MEK1 n=1 Tax=Saccharomycodes ludwigii TaxID=36035 RepID=A0A376B796_9ASCO|nr:hypothetical protein SCDLUD_003367 [Saccharomycodes ludwigii]KAH3900389.1 hypothetical protein SCDLUD_003367 [Saccharomycodes ludwigii]SSD60567.1 related to Meiosis-specific serine/threonine-protein kinase MEK1 [Saccharomycodes ludwigii]